MNVLDTYVQGWRESADAVLVIAADLTVDRASTVTDCPGWTVQDVIAHLAHLETALCASTSEPGSAGAPELVSSYTEAGVADRRSLSLGDVVAELRTAVERRTEILADQLADDPAPEDPAPVTPGGIGWSYDVLLRNRCIDMWVHEQDLRRALDRPGGFDGTAAQVVTMAFSFAMPYVLGKRVRPEPGSIVRWDVTGDVPVDLAVRVGDDGRAQRLELVDGPATTLSMTTETFTALAAGRRTADAVEVSIDGDAQLGRAVLAAMAVTP